MRKFTLSAVLSLLSVVASVIQAAPLLQPGDRVVFVGDSITGQGGNSKTGWVGLIGSALKAQDATNHQTLVPLGGSGQTVSSWGNVERKSRTASSFLDVKGFDVQAELSQHADVVIIMLGMNDVLSPRQQDQPESYRRWIADYRALINALRERTTPRLIALGTPTPCTEDPAGPKNVVMDKMVAELTTLAAEEKCVLLPTRAAAWEMLEAGRRLRPDFHITGDQVHPNGFGHAAIATGMLRGLGETEAAARLFGQSLAELRGASGAQALSYQWSLLPAETPPTDTLSIRLQVFHPGGKVALDLPEGWAVKESKQVAGESVFVVSAKLDRLVNRIGLRAGGDSRAVLISAPWLVGTGNVGWHGWKSGVYDREAGKLPSDDAVRTGQGASELLTRGELKPGVPLVWKPFLGGVNYGGSGAPGVIDFAAVTYFSGAEVGYGMRWIKSDRERPVVIKIAKLGFAGTSHLEVWQNGETVYAGDPGKAKGQEFPVTLKAGWNLLSFKSNLQQWQWQFSIDIGATAGDNLDDLRFSSVPR